MSLDVYGAAGAEEVSLMLVHVAILLAATRFLGEVAQRYKQPSVVGELAAGILLGPSFLAHFFPEQAYLWMPTTAVAGHLLGVLTLLGSLTLLLNAGWEADLNLIRNHLRTATAVSISGIFIPFIGGALLGQFLPDFLVGEHHDRLLFSMFLGTALSISSISIISKVLSDLKLMRRDIGQTILASGTIDDTAGWILVSIVTTLARGQGITPASLGHSVGRLALFLFLNFTVGRWLVKRLVAWVQDETHGADRLLSMVVTLLFAWAAFADAIGLEPVVGAFFLGVLLSARRRVPREVRTKLRAVSQTALVPLFFAFAGLKVEMLPLLQPPLLGYGLLFLCVASGGKVIGTYLGARLIGRTDHWTALAMGAGMNARGSMEIIVATLGLTLGIIGPGMFTIIVVMALVMSFFTPIALTWIVPKITADPNEEQRLKREEMAEKSPVTRTARVLMPVHMRKEGIEIYDYEVQISKRMTRDRISVTLLNVTDESQAEAAENYLASIMELFEDPKDVTSKVVIEEDVAEAILKESTKDYDILILGSGPEPLSPLNRHLLKCAKCMTLVVRQSPQPREREKRKYLVPTNGRSEATRAAELAILLAQGEDEIQFLHVLDVKSHHEDYRIRLHAAYEFLGHMRELANAHSIRHSAELRLGDSVNDIIVDVCRSRDIDAVVLGTHLRTTREQVYLGAEVEKIVAEAPCAVLVLAKL